MPVPPDLRALLDAFFAPAPGAGPLALLHAAAELRARSSGALTSGAMFELQRPLVGGPWCPRLFGPIESLRCGCGRLVGPEHRGETCEGCHVLCTDEPLRDRRVAHLEVSFGLVHPALAPRIADLLGLDFDELRAVLLGEAVFLADGQLVAHEHHGIDWDDEMSYETGVAAIRRRLATAVDPELAAAGLSATALVLTSVPIPPPGERPLVHSPHLDEDRWFRELWSVQVGRDNEAIAALAARALRSERLLELGAPKILLDRDCAEAQQDFEAMLELLARPSDDPGRAPDPRLSGWRPAPHLGDDADHVPGAPYRFRLAGAPPVSEADDRDTHHRAPLRPEVPRACVLADGDRALIQLGYALLLVHWPTGHVLWVMPAAEARLLGARGDWALFGAKYGRQLDAEDPTLLHGLYALDLSSGTWLEGPYPDHLPAIFVEKGEPEDAWLSDWRGQRGAPGAEDLSGDRPDEWARSPDHRFVWMSSSPDDGAVLDSERGVAVLMISQMREPAADDVPTVALTGPERDENGEIEHQVAPGIALARVGEEWRILVPGGLLRRDGQVALEFTEAAIEGASFDSAGARLLLVNREALHVVEVERGQLLGQLDLRPLGPALALPECVPEALADLVLAHHGTLAAALTQPDDALRALGLDDEQLAALRAERPPPLPGQLDSTCP
ncbi:hypothetical protein [Nannocystis bainbridge]|uniref:DNA-directed RNA polymerase n=1 Tax=Nannocystis bainbridge TaxID=2995303 RepID=A0ABT5DQD4_9BACT|nr:hypothetical protein [Nannocystis bainbridge]MDC0715761.1 hypothetical protein [Nannocystis bainbridge]